MLSCNTLLGSERLMPSLSKFVLRPSIPSVTEKEDVNPLQISIRDRVFMLMFDRLSLDSTRKGPSSAGNTKDHGKKGSTVHEGRIAAALGLSLSKKIFSFCLKPKLYGLKPTLIKKTREDIETIFDYQVTLQPPRLRKHKTKKLGIEYLKPTTHVQAFGLKNDFYSSVISWSYEMDIVVVALSVHVYLWDYKTCRIFPIRLPFAEVITCVQCSYGDLVAVGTETGRIYICSQTDREVLAIYRLKNGDHIGDVYILEFISSIFHALYLKKGFTFHRQMVCGICMNMDQTQVAFGSNDDTVSVWNIANLDESQLMFVLPHRAAVKAMSFCPWSKNLLATGGGASDRHIRIWHTTSGTLLNYILTDSQLTSLTWSESAKQFIATFGFGDGRLMVLVYSYPEMKVLKAVRKPCGTRILSSTRSPNGGLLCVACSNSTVQVYRVWDCKKKVITVKEFGSKLINFLEGTDTMAQSFR